jgi:hypothetical protein
MGHGGGPCMLHNPSYDFNDDLIPLGATYWVRLAEAWLAKDAHDRMSGGAEFIRASYAEARAEVPAAAPTPAWPSSQAASAARARRRGPGDGRRARRRPQRRSCWS